jgi:hypothetical protein
MNNFDPQLLVIFGFVICVIAVKQFARFRREKMWHETARLALEKGQPPPPSPRASRDPQSAWSRSLQGGLVLIAVGAGMFVAMGPGGKAWGAIPAFVGVALVMHSILTRGRDGPAPSEPDKSDRLP